LKNKIVATRSATFPKIVGNVVSYNNLL